MIRAAILHACRGQSRRSFFSTDMVSQCPGGISAWNGVQENDLFLAGLSQWWRLMTNHFAQLLETVFRIGSRQPSWPGLRVDCCPFPPLMVSQCQGGISAWNGEYFLISVSEPYASLHLQFWLGVSESPAMVLLKGVVSSNLKVITQNPRSIYCSRSYSDRFTVILSSPIIAVRSIVRLLSLRGGGGFPA